MTCTPPISTLFPYTTLFRSPWGRVVRMMIADGQGVATKKGEKSQGRRSRQAQGLHPLGDFSPQGVQPLGLTAPYFPPQRDRKSTRLNSSHANISYAVFCLKK